MRNKYDFKLVTNGNIFVPMHFQKDLQDKDRQ